MARLKGPVPGKVVLADASHATTNCLAREFTKLGTQGVWLVERAAHALNLVVEVQAELLVLEIRLPDMDGLMLLKDVVKVSPNTICAILTSYGSVCSAVRAIRLGAAAYLTKPASAPDILRAIVREDSWFHTPADHMSLQRASWEYLNRVFQDAGSLSEAARRLGIDRTSLRRKLSSYAPPR
jgi:two-component system response regulator RegA